jgi:hypothetical protein
MKPRRGPTRFSSPENSNFFFFLLMWTTPRQQEMDAGWTLDGRLELLEKDALVSSRIGATLPPETVL